MAGTKLNPETYIPLWQRALGEEIGLYIDTDNRSVLVQELYEARKRAQDPRLEALMIFQPRDGIVFIAKKMVELDD
jgi:hypothetical protein